MPRPRSDLRPRILRAARERFLKEGVDGASLRQIAGDAGTSIAMVYYYFPTKEELFDAVVEDKYVDLMARLATALAPDVPVEDRVRRLCACFVDASDEEHAVMRLIVREIFVSSERRGRVLARFLRGHIPLLLGTVVEGRRDGSLDASGPPAATGLAMLTLAVFPQLLRRLIGDSAGPQALPLPDAQALATALGEILLHGVAAKGVS